MTAPTEAEILAMIEHVKSSGEWVGDAIAELMDPIVYRDDHVGCCLWTDLRPSEAARLDALGDEIYAALEAALDKLAREFPNAPRAKPRRAVAA